MAADGALVLGVFRLTRTGLEVTGTPSFDEWQACGQTLFGLSNASLWAIGDWIVYGEGRGDWGEMYTQAIDATQKSYQTVKAAAWAAEKFQLVRRRTNLSRTRCGTSLPAFVIGKKKGRCKCHRIDYCTSAPGTP